MSSLLFLDRVDFSYAGKPVLQSINMSLDRGEVLAVLGPSGCGKSSLLRLIAGLLIPSAGEVRFKDGPPQPGQGNALVFQSYRLLPWKTVRENILFALPNLSDADAEQRCQEVLHLVGLGAVAQAWPRTLSGGMQQRVALARALAVKPDLLLMDEPFAALDAQARELMQHELLRLVGASGGPGVVFVTHSVDEALTLGDRILLLSPRPGRMLAEFSLPFAARRWENDPRDHPEFASLRREIWVLSRESLLTDSASDFYQR